MNHPFLVLHHFSSHHLQIHFLDQTPLLLDHHRQILHLALNPILALHFDSLAYCFHHLILVYQESDSEQDEESDDDDQEEEEFDQENESEDDEMKSDEEQGMDGTTDQFNDDADVRLEEPTETATGIIHGEGNDTEMTEAQQGNENLKITQEQVVEDAHVIISTVWKKTEVPVTSSSRLSDLASKFLNFSDIPQTDAEIVSLLDVHAHHEVPRTQAPTLLTIPVLVIPESSPVFTNIPQSSHTFTPTPIQATPTPPRTIKTTNPLSNLLDFASVFRFNYRITALEKEVVDLKKDPLHTQVTSLVDSHLDKRSRKDKDKDEDPSAGSDRGLKKRKTSRDAEPTTGPKKKDSTSGSSNGTKSQPKFTRKSVQSEELVFEVADSDMTHDQTGNLGDNEDEPRDETASRRDWFKKPTPPQEPTDPDWNIGKTTQEGPTQNWLMTLAASTSTDKSLKDFDELMSTPIDFSGQQRKSFYAYARGIQSRGDVYSTKRILAVTHVSVMRKHGYGYLDEIVVRRFDNILYRFKEGYVPRLWINDIEDIYQKKINVTKPDTTRPDLRKRHPYTPYTDPQGFIYVNDHKRNMLMRSDELYKFSDGTLTRLLSSLDDITKNIDMEYLPKRRWSNLEKKRAHFMIKDINKLLKERRMMMIYGEFIWL
ncbi:hypothetical protein Tco_1569958 [Tanacetum coccineum]